jgi:hypothetical protein
LSAAKDTGMTRFLALTRCFSPATQYIQVDDVTALWRAIEGKVTAEWGPEKMPYGMLEFAIRDPDGYLLSFASASRTNDAHASMTIFGAARPPAPLLICAATLAAMSR